jgi:hypothetical protein
LDLYNRHIQESADIMKQSLLLAALATSGTLASPHGHLHKRLSHSHNHEKRGVEVVTVTVCKLGVMELPESVCDFYVNKGVLKYVDDGSGTPVVALAAPAASSVSHSHYESGNTTESDYC